MARALRDGNNECVFCGEGAMTPDAPCECEEAIEERQILKMIDAGKKKIARVFRDSERYIERFDDARLKILYNLVEPLARREVRRTVIDIGQLNKATLKRNKGTVSVFREEKQKEEADDEEEIEE